MPIYLYHNFTTVFLSLFTVSCYLLYHINYWFHRNYFPSHYYYQAVALKQNRRTANCCSKQCSVHGFVETTIYLYTSFRILYTNKCLVTHIFFYFALIIYNCNRLTRWYAHIAIHRFRIDAQLRLIGCILIQGHCPRTVRQCRKHAVFFVA